MLYSMAVKHQSITGRPHLGEILYPPLLLPRISRHVIAVPPISTARMFGSCQTSPPPLPLHPSAVLGPGNFNRSHSRSILSQTSQQCRGRPSPVDGSPSRRCKFVSTGSGSFAPSGRRPIPHITMMPNPAAVQTHRAGL